MRISVSFILSIVSLAIAIGLGIMIRDNFVENMDTEFVPIARANIPTYTVVQPEMFTIVEVPRLPDTQFPIYHRLEDLQGMITTQHVPAQSLAYRRAFSRVESFRLVDQPELEVVSIPVRSDRIAGGILRVGQQINLHRIAKMGRLPGDAVQLLEQRGAAVELLAENLEIRHVYPAGDLASSAATNVTNPTASGVQLITFGVPHDDAQRVIELIAGA